MKNKISVIVSDLGKVLVPFTYDKTIERLNEVEKGLGEKFINFFKTNYHIHRSFEKGKMTENEFLNHYSKVLENKIPADEFARFYSDIFTINEDVVSLLPLLKEKYKLVLLSNTDLLHYKYGYSNSEFLKHFDKLVLSFEVGAIKPEEKIFRIVEQFTGCPPEEHFFIDDIPEYIDAAQKYGWQGVVFTGYEKLVQDLTSLNII